MEAQLNNSEKLNSQLTESVNSLEDKVNNLKHLKETLTDEKIEISRNLEKITFQYTQAQTNENDIKSKLIQIEQKLLESQQKQEDYDSLQIRVNGIPKLQLRIQALESGSDLAEAKLETDSLRTQLTALGLESQATLKQVEANIQQKLSQLESERQGVVKELEELRRTSHQAGQVSQNKILDLEAKLRHATEFERIILITLMMVITSVSNLFTILFSMSPYLHMYDV